MTNDTLYTDYAIQILSAYVSQDLFSMKDLLESFKDEDVDEQLFMPGIIFGLMFHITNILNAFSEAAHVDVDEIFQSYAMDYASIRETIKDNPLLNVKTAGHALEELKEKYKDIEDLLRGEDDE